MNNQAIFINDTHKFLYFIDGNLFDKENAWIYLTSIGITDPKNELEFLENVNFIVVDTENDLYEKEN